MLYCSTVFQQMLKMVHGIFLAVILAVAFSGEGAWAADCCSAYTDPMGQHHDSVLCAEYCCLNADVAYKGCCDDPMRQIPATRNQNDKCVKSWLNEHMWVPIVGGIITLILFIAICTCCCCCGCCACCRKSPRHVIVHTPGPAAPSTTVAMSNTTTMAPNPIHYGYDQ